MDVNNISIPARSRRAFILTRLQRADGVIYDDLIAEVIDAFPYMPGRRAVRAVRLLMWHGLVTTEPDESVWLTPSGWQAAGELAARLVAS